ncbi:hypothetical protein [Paenibacillus alvei]|uniref:Uncharacterized protein n=1 Tax=Paenibacillus alvei TaxID=44250 RepID=A0AAP7DIW0_PAEAL|nr:hypothetical protein [Paenibacillus alvei]NOJ72143.1 hypothetical protein [Paenibacillus alvei]
MSYAELGESQKYKLTEQWKIWNDLHGEQLFQPQDTQIYISDELVFVRMKPAQLHADYMPSRINRHLLQRVQRAFSQWEQQQRGIMWESIIPRALGVHIARMWLSMPLQGGSTLDVIQLEVRPK